MKNYIFSIRKYIFNTYIPDINVRNLMCTIKELGKNLTSINLLIDTEALVLEDIIEGCPKLKNLTIEQMGEKVAEGPLTGDLEALKACK